MIDYYFRRPILWDYSIATVISALLLILTKQAVFGMPEHQNLYSIISDLSTISLTLAGFVLTLLTVLISFKSSIKPITAISKRNSAFEVFFSTILYFQTVKHLKNAIISLTLIAILGYALKLFIKSEHPGLLFFFDVFGVIVIFLTVWRCLTILAKIIKLQESTHQNE